MLPMNINRNPHGNTEAKGENLSSEELVDETLKMDRLLYLKIIIERGPLTSLQITREILARKKKIDREEVRNCDVSRKNPNINKRLRDLADIGILVDQNGIYSLAPLGVLISDNLSQLISCIDVIRKYEWFFSTHDYTVIPPQKLREVHKLQFAKQCNDYFEYTYELESNTTKIDKEMRIVTDRLHDIPDWIIQEIKRNNLELELVYQFWKPFKMNFDEEKSLWEELTQGISSSIEIRYLMLKDKNPIGIRIIDQKWAIFSLYEYGEGKLNRPRSFYGEDKQFLAWIEDIFSIIWNNSKLLDTNQFTAHTGDETKIL
jgi:predicted transcriptional regulator